ncbi:hypothetical protein L2E82_27108 [Cichorium intybus]|uniref:Uncharacterized protein n=1 Tax=Cichorium intybus TaxID=13427 RepID=A0ACB9CSG9_CICIN|nr:hypothetical protein L2E82_27108 [Cichorium intybus]
MKRAYNGREIGRNGVNNLTMKEFKKWLMTFDENKDGRISRDELRQAIRLTGGGCFSFSTFKAWRGVKSADANHSGYIDYDEIESLVEFADKVLLLKIVGR